MNKWLGIGRLCNDPEISTAQSGIRVARYRLAVNRRVKPGEQPQADFLNCVVFGKAVDFVEKYLHKGMKIAVEGRVQTGSYDNRDGVKVYTTDIVVENHEFCESRRTDGASDQEQAGYSANEPMPVETDELPF